MGQQHLTEQRFSSLELDDRLLGALDSLEFHYCTPIQARSLPLLLSGKDVSGQAQTGTGKTLAFLLACAQRLLHSDQPPTAPVGSPARRTVHRSSPLAWASTASPRPRAVVVPTRPYREATLVRGAKYAES